MEDAKGAAEGKMKRQEQTLPFHHLFSFADRFDYLLNAAGSFRAIVHGAAMPVFFLLLGDLVNDFGKNQANLGKMTGEVSKYALYFVYLGFIVCVSLYAGLCDAFLDQLSYLHR